jgi:hypothetical protein
MALLKVVGDGPAKIETSRSPWRNHHKGYCEDPLTDTKSEQPNDVALYLTESLD